jgi:hypothetical protein
VILIRNGVLKENPGFIANIIHAEGVRHGAESTSTAAPAI